MERKHSMPFGAQCLADGGVHFRLWAPKPERVALLVDGAALQMKKTEGGWFELITSQAKAGSRYQFAIDGQLRVPDPASRFQPDDVHQPSEVIAPATFDWKDESWKGRPWEEAVIYELHVGTFSSAGTYAGVEEKLDYLAALGITAIELMPLSDFFGKRNWGYDGVLPFAPDSSYGRPEDLKRLIQSAHSKGLMVLLDVVYNHFGPEGNYLHAYAPQFFTHRHCTPWGDGINFDGEHSRPVRDFFIHNAIYWLEEFHFDGLRFDAVHAIQDDSSPNILIELATTVREHFGVDRHIHLVLENEDNAARYLRKLPGDQTTLYDAQWNDDIHHVCHVLSSGESDGYYSDYADNPVRLFGKCLAEGFVFQGQASAFRDGKHRGEPSRNLSPSSFVDFLQNHDQVGNRAFGERILNYAKPEAVRALMAVLLLAPSPPLLFMGEEFAASTPFLFFCDFEADLAKAVTEGRRAEFARFSQFRDPAIRERIPDPNAERTFLSSKLNWSSIQETQHADWHRFYSELLAIRKREVVPLLHENISQPPEAAYLEQHQTGLTVCWKFQNKVLQLHANLGHAATSFHRPAQSSIYETFDTANATEMPAWSVAWFIKA
ncbi:MAG TPA: malto-oligosyltrehalose trehalohydrolase [Terriglobales bacterium]|nr:malto-oligosyltrehalose trehalohydrolase [Terriglobales bacterium]